MTLKIYCELCEAHQSVEITPIEADDLNPGPWGEIVCQTCHLVIATMSAEEPGRLMFVAEADAAEARDSGLLPVTIGVNADDLRRVRAVIKGMRSND